MKKVMSIMVAAIFCLISVMPSFAMEQSEAALISEMESVLSETNLEMGINASVAEWNGEDILFEFDSIEEFENFVRTASVSTTPEFTNEVNAPLATRAQKTLYTDDNITIKYYPPGLGNGPTTVNIGKVRTYFVVNYSGNPVRFSSVEEVNSTTAPGAYIFAWNHLVASKGLTNSNRTAWANVTGTYTIGVSVGGIPVGFSGDHTFYAEVHYSQV